MTLLSHVCAVLAGRKSTGGCSSPTAKIFSIADNSSKAAVSPISPAEALRRGVSTTSSSPPSYTRPAPRKLEDSYSGNSPLRKGKPPFFAGSGGSSSGSATGSANSLDAAALGEAAGWSETPLRSHDERCVSEQPINYYTLLDILARSLVVHC